MEYPEKIVNFEKYCKTCKFKKADESWDPCDDCLNHPVNTNSERPVRWRAE